MDGERRDKKKIWLKQREKWWRNGNFLKYNDGIINGVGEYNK